MEFSLALLFAEAEPNLILEVSGSAAVKFV